MSEKIQKNFFFFLIPFTPNFLFRFYYKYDRKLVFVIFVKKKKKREKREKRAVESSPPFPNKKEGENECINSA